MSIPQILPVAHGALVQTCAASLFVQPPSSRMAFPCGATGAAMVGMIRG
ncbi:hypothetical protein ATPR_1818 [Acetobacter tropicalis NBRC 101654]|uniref:Uncharacterized protein n=1 Tax=Acetobacter tropicalis NBRC 101654 TaxID=749388 RepID=F7VEL9_9PROT|nr:hypothetical protein ATPR_1818 [Acetobacter tropicalis NBRC 101654]